MSDIRFNFLAPTIEDLRTKKPSEIQAILKNAETPKGITTDVLDACFLSGIILYYGIHVPQSIENCLQMFDRSRKYAPMEESTERDALDRNDKFWFLIGNVSLASIEGRINLSNTFYLVISYLHPAAKPISLTKFTEEIKSVAGQFGHLYMVWSFAAELLSCNNAFIYVDFSEKYLSYSDVSTIPPGYPSSDFLSVNNFRIVTHGPTTAVNGCIHPSREGDMLKAWKQVAKVSRKYMEKKANFYLGNFYQQGLHCEKNPEKALAHYMKASEVSTETSALNIPEAFRAWSLCYLTGTGVAKDDDKAVDAMVSYINAVFPPSNLSVIDSIDAFAPFTAYARRGFAYFLLYCECSNHFPDYKGLLKNDPKAIPVTKKSDIEWTHLLLFKAVELGYQPAKDFLTRHSNLSQAFEDYVKLGKVTRKYMRI